MPSCHRSGRDLPHTTIYPAERLHGRGRDPQSHRWISSGPWAHGEPKVHAAKQLKALWARDIGSEGNVWGWRTVTGGEDVRSSLWNAVLTEKPQ